MVSAHDPENGPGTRGPGNSRPSLTRPRKPAGTAADQQVSRLVTPDTTEKPGRSEYQDNQPGISDKSYRAKRRTRPVQPADANVAAGDGMRARLRSKGYDLARFDAPKPTEPRFFLLCGLIGWPEDHRS